MSGSPAVVQSASNSGTTSPVTVTLGSATTARNCLVACIGEGNSTTNPTVSGITVGGSADNWAQAAANIVNADANAEIWTDQNCAGGQTAISVAFNAGTGVGNGYTAWLFEISLIALAAAVDGAAAAGAGSGSSFSSGNTAALAQAGEMAVGVGVAIGASGAPTIIGPSSGWTNQAALHAARTSMIAGTQLLASTAAAAYAGSLTSGRDGAAVITLKPSPSGNLLLLKFP